MWHNFVYRLSSISLSIRVFVSIILWIAFISYMHHMLNGEHIKVRTIKMGYMPVITNLAAPILDHVSKDNLNIKFKALKFSSFAEMGEALRNGGIDVAFIIAPLSIVLRQQGEDVKIVYIGNRHESTFVTRKKLKIKTLRDLVGKTVAVPMRYSGHNLTVLDLINKNGLDGKIKVVEMNPPDMASALMSGSLDAYFVGEPFAAQTLKSGHADLFYYAEDLLKDFICNVAIVRNDLIQSDPATVKLLVESAARSGVWAQNNPVQAASVVANYWNQPPDLVKYALTLPKDRTVYDLYIPKYSEMKKMANEMMKFKLIANSNIKGLVDDSFAKNLDMTDVYTINSIIK